MKIEGEYGENFKLPRECKDLESVMRNHNNITKLKISPDYLVDEHHLTQNISYYVTPSELKKLTNCLSEINSERKNFNTTEFPFIPTLKSLEISNCSSLKCISNKYDCGSSLKELTISSCEKFSFLDSKLDDLTYLKIENCENIDFFPSLKSLKTLVIEKFNNQSFQTFERKNVESIEISGCNDLMLVDFLSYTNLKNIKITFCNSIVFLKIEGCANLESLIIEDCDNLATLDLSSQEPIPKNRKIKHCDKLLNVFLPEKLEQMISDQSENSFL
jgi:hypothetical protein